MLRLYIYNFSSNRNFSDRKKSLTTFQNMTVKYFDRYQLLVVENPLCLGFWLFIKSMNNE